MSPEIEAILGVYQRRLNEMTAQAIAFEARIQVLNAEIENLKTQSTSKRSTTKKTTTDAGEF